MDDATPEIGVQCVATFNLLCDLSQGGTDRAIEKLNFAGVGTGSFHPTNAPLL